MSKKSIIIILFSLMLLPLPIQASAGIPIQKDVFLESIRDLQPEIRNYMDFPDQITFNLYDSQTAITPIATQTKMIWVGIEVGGTEIGNRT